METLLKKAEGINFKKAFIGFFAALLIFGIIYVIALAVSGNSSTLSLLWERITLTRFRTRIAANPFHIFRVFRVFFVIGFHALLALWVYVDSKKHNIHQAIWPALTLCTGLIGWLIYLIKRVDRTDLRKKSLHP